MRMPIVRTRHEADEFGDHSTRSGAKCFRSVRRVAYALRYEPTRGISPYHSP
jgi:hypothetical protein